MPLLNRADASSRWGACPDKRNHSIVQTPISAVATIKPMRGGSRSQLMLCSDGHLWVVKFQNNPQHLRILANEFLATHIAATVGLSVPKCDVIQVSGPLLETETASNPKHREAAALSCRSNLHFGVRYVGGLMPGRVADILTEDQLDTLRNVEEFAGILALDKWLDNCDNRQAVFTRTSRETRYRAIFIDHGHCFNGGNWTFPDSQLAGIYWPIRVYAKVTGWESFEPWIARIENFDCAILWNIAKELPPEWCGENEFMLEQLIDTVIKRRRGVRNSIENLRRSGKNPFRNWSSTKSVAIMSGALRRNLH